VRSSGTRRPIREPLADEAGVAPAEHLTDYAASTLEWTCRSAPAPADSRTVDGPRGSAGEFKLGTERRSGPIDLDALAEHLASAGTLAIPALDRITRTN
jgi:hypothetical protein